jgi:pseudo-rSAM protein
MNTTNKFLILEPYVFVNIQENTVLLYNSSNGHKIIISNSNISTLLQRNSNELYVFPLYDEDFKNIIISNFIDNIKKYQMGIVILVDKIPPVQFSPILNIQSTDKTDYTDKRFIDSYLLNLHEISLYINNGKSNGKCNSENFYKQVLCNFFEAEYKELNISILNRFLAPVLLLKNLKKINILGGNIFRYSNFCELIEILQNYCTSSLVCFYVNIEDVIFDIKQVEFLLNQKNFRLVFCLSNSLKKSNLEKMLNMLPSSNEFTFNCFIQDFNDIEFFHSLLGAYNMQMLPIYNGKNLSLFQENVFITQEDIDQLFITENDVFKNKSFNQNYYGKLIITSNGSVFSNLNTQPLGEINDLLINILAQEMNKRDSWFLTRLNTKPCNMCIYNFLCPAISNYEFTFHRYNLCDIYH